MNEIIDSFSNRLNEAIRIRNIKPIELSEKTGIDKSKISSYMNGRYKAKQKGVYLLAKALNVSEAWLMGLDVPMNKDINIIKKKTVKIPVLGKVAGGTPIEAISNIDPDEYIEIDEDMAKKGEMFGLIVKGQSMFPYILENDIVVVQKQDHCENGKVAVVMINGDEATVKVVKKKEDGLDLESYNPIFPTFHFSSQEVIDKPIKIIGIVKELRRRNINM